MFSKKDAINQDDDFYIYFEKTSWDSHSQWELLKSYIVENILNYNIDEIDTETKSPVMLGALIGECGNEYNILSFIRNNIDSNKHIMIALACYSHSQYKTEDMKYLINSKYEDSPSYIKYLIDNIFERKQQNTKESTIKINRQYNILIPEISDILNNNNLISKIDTIIKQIKKYDDKNIIHKTQNKVPVFENTIIDDISYSMTEILKKHKTEHTNILVIYIMNIMGQFITKEKIEALMHIIKIFSYQEYNIISTEVMDKTIRLLKLYDNQIIDYVSQINDINKEKVKSVYDIIISQI
jgi:hypothetical protein